MARTAERFLDGFGALEDALRKIARAEPRAGFASSLRKAAERSTAVAAHRSLLESLADLRNAIVHTPSQEGRPIADPRPDIVKELFETLELIRKPPSLLPEFKVSVTMCQIADPIIGPIERMREGKFSQLPVYEGSRFAAVLTAETFTRWAAAKGATMPLDTTAVEVVLKHAESDDNYQFLDHKATVYDALGAFDDWATQGKYLDALLVSRNAETDRTPDAILTTFDIPRLRASAHLR